MALTIDDYHLEPTAALLGQTLPRLLRSAAETAPDTMAFGDGQQSWTWQQWWDETEALARGLQELGVLAGDVVVAQLPNGWDFLVLHSAVAAVGAVLLPVHSGNSSLELAALARRGNARVIVVLAERLCPELTSAVGTVVIAGALRHPAHPSMRDLVQEFAGAGPKPVRVRPEDPFLLLPSSATTSARPKIAMHSHDGLLSNAAAVVTAGCFRRTDTVISASPFTHLFGLLSVHVSLFARSSQLLLPSWDADRLISLAGTATDPVVLYAVPTQLWDLVGRLDAIGPDRSIRLSEVRTGGSKVPAVLVERLRHRCDASIVVQWGMSELGAGLFTSADDPPETATGVSAGPCPAPRFASCATRSTVRLVKRASCGCTVAMRSGVIWVTPS